MNRALVVANFVQACCWSVDQAPAAGETRLAQGFHSEPGGKGLNVAIALQRLGMQVTPVLAHGNDAAGAQLVHLLQQEGMDAQHAHALEMPSGWGAGFVEPCGQNRIAVFPGANAHLGPAHIAQAEPAMRQSAFVYAQLEVAWEAAEHAMQLGRQLGKATILNPSPWRPMSDAMRASVGTYIVNSHEAEALLGTPVNAPCAGQRIDALANALRAAIERFWQHHDAARELIVTLGEWGSIGWRHPSEHQPKPPQAVPATRVAVRDTVGCGDAFAAGFCWARYARGAALENALKVGNACGAHMAARAGVLAALPRHRQLQEEWQLDSLIGLTPESC